MKVFISWSGELSKATAEHLKKWIPCIVQSVEVFFLQRILKRVKIGTVKFLKFFQSAITE